MALWTNMCQLADSQIILKKRWFTNVFMSHVFIEKLNKYSKKSSIDDSGF
jgi:hypothetical protein